MHVKSIDKFWSLYKIQSASNIIAVVNLFVVVVKYNIFCFQSYFYNDDTFNFNYAQAKAAVGNFKEAEEVNTIDILPT